MYNTKYKGGVIMNIEEKVKELILSRYNSIREFTIAIDIPYTTMDSIFKRGIGNSSISNVIKICKALNISVDALADGEIVPYKTTLTDLTNRIEIKELLSDTKDILIRSDNLLLDGKPLSKSERDSIINAMEVGVEITRKNR
jgi:hypothetical protein